MSAPNSENESAPLLAEEWRRRRQGSIRENNLQGISPIVSEDSDSITIRRPVQYYCINNQNQRGRSSSNQDVPEHTDSTKAAVNRYKYYSKLAPNRENMLLMPNHVVPSEFYTIIPFNLESGTQSSIITIFSIWNTMMGTSLLSMPWALEKSGFICGLTLMIIMAGLTLYTAYRVMTSPKNLDVPDVLEFCDICRYYLGKSGYYISVMFSLIALLGAAIVYWVLMSNFLYHSVEFVYEKVNHEFNTSAIVIGNISYDDAYCPHPKEDHYTTMSPLISTTSLPFNSTTEFPVISTTPSNISIPDAMEMNHKGNHTTEDLLKQIWSQTHTVPFFLLLFLLPLINFKSPTFFTKFNALGTISVAYIIVFICVKASKWGIHLDFNAPPGPLYIPKFQWTFPALTGTLSLAMFIHNCVISIVRNQKHPENNGRDLSIAYICVTLTYVIIGGLFYASFPLPKTCIEDNLLNNFRSSDIFAFAARIFLFFQMITVFPLIMYIFRVQFMHTVFGNVYPSLKHVMALNLAIISICLVFAVFMPKIGTIIRFSGALCGLVYIFALPCIVYMLSLKQRQNLAWGVVIVHAIIITLGVANFVGQFLIMGKA